VSPPGNQAANGENKLQPVAMGVPGLLDQSSLLPEEIKHRTILHVVGAPVKTGEE